MPHFYFNENNVFLAVLSGIVNKSYIFIPVFSNNFGGSTVLYDVIDLLKRTECRITPQYS